MCDALWNMNLEFYNMLMATRSHAFIASMPYKRIIRTHTSANAATPYRVCTHVWHLCVMSTGEIRILSFQLKWTCIAQYVIYMNTFGAKYSKPSEDGYSNGLTTTPMLLHNYEFWSYTSHIRKSCVHSVYELFTFFSLSGFFFFFQTEKER